MWQPKKIGHLSRVHRFHGIPVRVIAVQPNNFNMMAYVSGYLLYTNERRLAAQRIDANGMPQGDPIRVADAIESSGFSVSETGLLIFRKAVPTAGKQLLWFNRDGKPMGQVGPVADHGNVDISPKGDRALVDMITGSNRDIWTIDLERAVPQRVTFDPANDWTGSWSPDGTRVAFASSGRAGSNGVTRIYEKSATGTGAETVVPTGDVSSILVNWSSDDKYLVFSRLRSRGDVAKYDTWVLPLFGDRKPMPLLESDFDKVQARVSPDSRFIAFSTNESGSYQVVVQTFPDPNGGKWQISAEGGIEPKWRRDGRELYYLAFDGKLMSVSVNGSVFGRPTPLFQTPAPLSTAATPTVIAVTTSRRTAVFSWLFPPPRAPRCRTRFSSIGPPGLEK